MSLNTEKTEIDALLARLFDNLSLTISSVTGTGSASLRQKMGDLRANYDSYLADKTFADKLLAFFTLARQSGASLISFSNVRNGLLEEKPVGEYPIAIVQAALIYSLSAESRIISNASFVSRDDVEATIKTMKAAFDKAREMAADLIDSSSYQTLTLLAGALTAHLANTARPLPRMVTFNMRATFPALTLSNVIYHSAERWEEIVNENHIIHPAFCLREIRGLST